IGGNAAVGTLVGNLANLWVDAAHDFSIDAPISYPGGTVMLVGGGVLNQTDIITAASLGIVAVGPVTLDADNAVGTLAAQMQNTGHAFLFNDFDTDLTIGTVNGLSGVSNFNADITLETTGTGKITLDAPVNTNGLTTSTTLGASPGTVFLFAAD